jgi:hypothetical protein
MNYNDTLLDIEGHRCCVSYGYNIVGRGSNPNDTVKDVCSIELVYAQEDLPPKIIDDIENSLVYHFVYYAEQINERIN